MPSESSWPLLLALALAALFTALLVSHWVLAGISGGLVAVALGGWNWTEPGE